PLAAEVQRDDGERRSGEAPTRGREREAEEARRAVRARKRFAEGGAGKKVVTPSVRREVVNLFKSRGHSERRACTLVGMRRSTCRYRGRRVEDQRLVERLHEPPRERPRHRYQLLTTPLRRD